MLRTVPRELTFRVRRILHPQKSVTFDGSSRPPRYLSRGHPWSGASLQALIRPTHTSNVHLLSSHLLHLHRHLIREPARFYRFRRPSPIRKTLGIFPSPIDPSWVPDIQSRIYSSSKTLHWSRNRLRYLRWKNGWARLYQHGLRRHRESPAKSLA